MIDTLVRFLGIVVFLRGLAVYRAVVQSVISLNMLLAILLRVVRVHVVRPRLERCMKWLWYLLPSQASRVMMAHDVLAAYTRTVMFHNVAKLILVVHGVDLVSLFIHARFAQRCRLRLIKCLCVAFVSIRTRKILRNGSVMLAE